MILIDLFESPGVMDLMKQVYAKCQSWFKSLHEERMKRILLHYGPFPTLESPDPPVQVSPVQAPQNGCPFFEPDKDKLAMFLTEAMLRASEEEEAEEPEQAPPKYFPEDGPSWMWYMTAILPVRESVKVSLLSSTSVRSRLKYLNNIVTVALRNSSWR